MKLETMPQIIEKESRQHYTDRLRLQMIDSMDDEKLARFDIFRADDLRHYMQEQKKWIEKENWFLGEKLGRPPTNGDLIKDMKDRRIRERYKAFYCIKYFDMISADELESAD